MKVEEKCPRGRPRSWWEQLVRKYVTQRGGPWEETEEEEEESWEDRDRWKGLVIRCPT
jgi:hypothetical protein